MKKVSVFLIVFFLTVSLAGGIVYTKEYKNNSESNVSYNEDDEYPENLRPGSFKTDSESESEIDDTTNPEEELTSDENFEDFDIEEDTEETEDETETTDSETTENSEPTEPEATPESTQPDNNAEAPETTETSDSDITSGKEIEIINSKVNIRREPNREAKILTALPIGTRGILLEEGDGWSRVRFGDVEGYLGNSYWKLV